MFALFKVLLDWINDELSELRIVLRDITEDLYDGQILAILMGMLIIFFSVIRTIIITACSTVLVSVNYYNCSRM